MGDYLPSVNPSSITFILGSHILFFFSFFLQYFLLILLVVNALRKPLPAVLSPDFPGCFSRFLGQYEQYERYDWSNRFITSYLIGQRKCYDIISPK